LCSKGFSCDVDGIDARPLRSRCKESARQAKDFRFDPGGSHGSSSINPLDMCQDFDMRECDDQPMGYLLYRVMAVLRPQMAAELGPMGLGLPEFVCLRILSVLPDQSSAELARNTNVSPQAMNLVLRGLQEMGAVTRPATVSSGRALPARLTSKGKALLKRAEAAVDVADERLLANLTPDERREFKRILHAVGSQPIDVAAPPCMSSNAASNKRANT
jgi:DNA-binding MarR family transcriptional regulator